MEGGIARLHRSVSLIHGAVSEVLGLQRGRKNDLSPVAMSILYATTVKKTRMNDVAVAYGIRKSTASRHVDNLEKKGYVRRTRDGEDHRVIYVEATDSGRQWVSEKEKILGKYVENGLSRLSPDEQEQFIGLLSKFVGEESGE